MKLSVEELAAELLGLEIEGPDGETSVEVTSRNGVRHAGQCAPDPAESDHAERETETE